jgi:hypothetical protein
MDAISGFRTLPIWLDLPGLRVVHACWHDASREALVPLLDEAGRFTEQGVLESYRHGSAAYSAVEILLKGPEEGLPAGLHFFDKDGHRREEVRLRWWDQNATTFRKAALGMDGREDEIPDSRGTMGITKASQYSLGIIGSRTDRKSQRQMQRAWISALLRRAT